MPDGKKDCISLKVYEDGEIWLVEEGLTLKERMIDPKSLLNMLEQSIETKVLESYHSGPLPKGTIYYGVIERFTKSEQIVVLEREKCIKSYNHFGEIWVVGYPKLLFTYIISGSSANKGYVVAVKDEIINNSSILYHFPYANVFENGAICWGNYQHPQINSLFELNYQPEMLYYIEHTHHHNAKGQIILDLLNQAKGKDYDPNLLIPLTTFKKYMDAIMQ